MIFWSLLFVVALHVYMFRDRGLLDPVSVFFLAFLYYSYLAPIVMLQYSEFGVAIAEQTSWITQGTIDDAAIVYALGYASYAIAYSYFSRYQNAKIYETKHMKFSELISDNFVRVLMSTILLIMFIIFAFFSGDFLAATTSYGDKITTNYESSVYGFTMGVLFSLMSLTSNYIILNSRRYVLATIVFCIMFFTFAILTFSKAPFIFCALAAFCAIYRVRGIPFIVTITGLVGAAILFSMLIIPAFSIYRGTGEFAITWPTASSVSLVLNEAASPFTIMHMALTGYVNTDNHPLWHSFVLWIPRFIWVDRPVDIAEGLAQQVIVNWQSGFGLGFSLFAEGAARYGVAGSALFMGLVGGVTAIMQGFFARMLPPLIRLPALLTLGGLVSVLVIRGAFSGLITNGLQNWIPVVVICFVAHRIAMTMDEYQQGRQVPAGLAATS